MSNDTVDERLAGLWLHIEEPLTCGAIVIVEEGGIRVRRLPIGGV